MDIKVLSLARAALIIAKNDENMYSLICDQYVTNQLWQVVL